MTAASMIGGSVSRNNIGFICGTFGGNGHS